VIGLTAKNAWGPLSRVPVVGSRVFSLGVSVTAPYFLTIGPHVVALEPGRAEVRMANRWHVRNHLGTVHAIAMCNLAEVAMGVLAEKTVPDTHRWIPVGMTVRYLAKGETDLRAIAEARLPELGDDEVEVTVPVRVLDDHDVEVCHADITIRIDTRPARSGR
jgi:acyl-coenzyme A thioesterase PaaI-like protein